MVRLNILNGTKAARLRRAGGGPALVPQGVGARPPRRRRGTQPPCPDCRRAPVDARAAPGHASTASQVCDAAFSPDGTRLLARSDGSEVYLWDYEHSRLLTPPLAHSDRVRQACWSPDGRRSPRRQPTGLLRSGMPGPDPAGTTLAHCIPGQLGCLPPAGKPARHRRRGRDRPAMGNGDRQTARLAVPGRSGRRSGRIFGRRIQAHHRRSRRCGAGLVVRSAQGDFPALAVSGVDPRPSDISSTTTVGRGSAGTTGRSFRSRMRTWSSGRDQATGSRRSISATRSPRFIRSRVRTGVLATGDRYNRVAVVRLTDGKDVYVLSHPRQANIGTVSPDGKYLMTASSGGLIHLRFAATGELVWPPQACGDFASAVAVSRDGKRALAASQDGTIRVWAARPRAVEVQPGNPDDSASNLAVPTPERSNAGLQPGRRAIRRIWRAGRRPSSARSTPAAGDSACKPSRAGRRWSCSATTARDSSYSARNSSAPGTPGPESRQVRSFASRPRARDRP